MAQIPPTQQPADGTQLVKPSDWPHYMVDAALLFTSDDKTPALYKDTDDARMCILNTLNWHEAHDEYTWPDFARVRLDFSQIMRFRRALVSDVFVSLHRAGKVRISRGEGNLGTPDSVAERAGKRKGAAVSCHLGQRKRLCKREEGSDNDADSGDAENSAGAEDNLLTAGMRELMDRAGIDPAAAHGGSEALADVVHEGLVDLWDDYFADDD